MSIVWDDKQSRDVATYAERAHAIEEAARLNADETLRNAAGAMREALSSISLNLETCTRVDMTKQELLLYIKTVIEEAKSALRLADGE